MENLKQRFIEFMLSAGALKFGDFTTKSGRKTPYFINTGAYITGSQIDKLGEFYAQAIHSAFGDEVDNLFGPAYKGIPLAVTAAIATHRLFGKELSYTFNRKELKDHGEGGTLVGYAYTGLGSSKDASSKEVSAEKICRVVLIEDVTTAGTSVRECLPLLNKPGVKPVGLAVSVDRMEKGSGNRPALREIREDYGLKTVAIVSFLDILAYLESPAGSGYLKGDATLVERMKAYYKEYGAE